MVNKPTLKISFFSFLERWSRRVVTALQTLPTELVVLSAMSVLVRLSTQHLESSGKASDSLTPSDSHPSCIFLLLTSISLFSLYFRVFKLSSSSCHKFFAQPSKHNRNPGFLEKEHNVIHSVIVVPMLPPCF